MCRVRLLIIVLCLSLHHSYQYQISTVDLETSEPDNHFDIIIFTQEWPVSYCKYWKRVTPGGECIFPHKENHWTVHGIWPWVHGDDFPDYCNNSWPFDPEQIRSIEDDLKEAWTNIFKAQSETGKWIKFNLQDLITDNGTSEKETHYTFWDHEWSRHGTCAAVLEPFNTQLKFFTKGIEWNQKYSMSDMLAAAKIFPSDTKELNPEEFVNAVKAKTKTDPMVICHNLDDNGVPFIWELRLCLDKQFHFIDCDPVVSRTCGSSKIIFSCYGMI